MLDSIELCIDGCAVTVCPPAGTPAEGSEMRAGLTPDQIAALIALILQIVAIFSKPKATAVAVGKPK